MVEINNELPSGIKALFDDSSTTSITNNTVKIQNFRENQIRMYVEKSAKDEKDFQRYAKQHADFSSKSNELKASLRNENALIDKMRRAYK